MTEALKDPMDLAIAAAWKVRREVSPNPWVGAVIVPKGNLQNTSKWVVGATRYKGDHAEVAAINKARERSIDLKGATIYVTLEPCSHFGNTPPCTQAIIESGITQVVFGVLDSDPRVCGSGVSALSDSRIEVIQANLEHQELIKYQLRGYLHQRKNKRPYVVLKMAMTLDGYIATRNGETTWITSETSRDDVQQIRADSDAILVGANTIRKDNPSLRIHPSGPGSFEGLRSIADNLEALEDIGTGKRPKELARIVLGNIVPGSKVEPASSFTGDISQLLLGLNDDGIIQLMVEGGAYVAYEFHSRGLVDEYVFYISPTIIGGSNGVPLMDGEGAVDLNSSFKGQITQVRRFGPDIRITVLPQSG